MVILAVHRGVPSSGYVAVADEYCGNEDKAHVAVSQMSISAPFASQTTQPDDVFRAERSDNGLSDKALPKLACPIRGIAGRGTLRIGS